MKQSVTVQAPATIANLVCGYDVLGVAVEAPADKVTVRSSAKQGVKIIEITGDGGRLPLDARRNTAGFGVIRLLETIGEKAGIEIALAKHLPLGSGMGSSAASAVAAIVAANELLNNPLDQHQMLKIAVECEQLAAGSPHADNVAPALFGGFVLIRDQQQLDVVKLETSLELFCTLIHPHIEVNTRSARELLRKNVPLTQAVDQWGNLGGFVAGLLQGNTNLMSRSMKDKIVEPVRAMMIPGFEEVRSAALESGAIGAGLSGSGPTCFCLTDNREAAEQAARKMKQAFAGYRIESDSYVSPVNTKGTRII